MQVLSPDLLISAYIQGVFPMAEVDGTIHWYSPNPRAIIPIESYKPSKSLKPTLNKNKFEIRINGQFEKVIRACAGVRKHETETWISEEIIENYTKLSEMGLAHSVEAYLENELVGGLYGVSIGGAFMGESMFHIAPDASKVAFHYLIEIMRKKGLTLLDTQFMNDNVMRYGAIEISREKYLQLLATAIKLPVKFTNKIGPYSLTEVFEETC